MTAALNPHPVELPMQGHGGHIGLPALHAPASPARGLSLVTLELGFRDHPFVVFAAALDSVLRLAIDRREKPHNLEGSRRGIEARRSRKLDQLAKLALMSCHPSL
jgi:hypothetical protein